MFNVQDNMLIVQTDEVDVAENCKNRLYTVHNNVCLFVRSSRQKKTYPYIILNILK